MLKTFFCFLLLTITLSAQQKEQSLNRYFALGNMNEQELIKYLSTAGSRERIIALCSYQEMSGSKNLTEKRLNDLFGKLDRIASTDKEFRAYLDFYKRLSPTIFIPEKDRTTTNKKMIALYDKAIDYYLSVGNEEFAGICLIHKGFDSFMLESYGNSVESMLYGHELLKKTGYGNVVLASKYLHDMTLIFYFLGDYEKVVELMEISAKIPPFDTNRDIQRFNNLGVAYLALNNKPKAEEAFLKTLERAKKYNIKVWRALASAKIAELYFERGEYQQALQLYQSTLGFIDKASTPREYANHLLGIAKTYLKQGNIQEAGKYIAMAGEPAIPRNTKLYYFGEKQNIEKYWQAWYKVNYNYFEAVSDYKNALLYLDSLTVLNRKQDSTYNVLQVHIAEHKLNLQKTLNEKKIFRIRAWSIGAGITFLTVIFALLFYIGKIRRKKEQVEFLYKEQLMKKEQKRLSSELERLKAQLDKHLKNIRKNNELIEQYKAENENDETKIDIENLKILTKEHWENFIRDFKKAHKRFYFKITKTYPNLTPSELRLVLLLKLGIPQKNLPGVLGTSDGNIRVTLHRLRQKINQNGKVIQSNEILNFISGL